MFELYPYKDIVVQQTKIKMIILNKKEILLIYYKRIKKKEKKKVEENLHNLHS